MFFLNFDSLFSFAFTNGFSIFSSGLPWIVLAIRDAIWYSRIVGRFKNKQRNRSKSLSFCMLGRIADVRKWDAMN